MPFPAVTSSYTCSSSLLVRILNEYRPSHTDSPCYSVLVRKEHEAEEQQNNDWEKNNVSNTNEEN